MGQTAAATISFHANADSPAGDGLKSVLSDPVERLSPDEFWALFILDLRSRSQLFLDGKRIEALDGARPEGSLLTMQSGEIYEWVVYRDIDEAECYCYGTDVSRSRLQWRGTLKVHRHPFRIEFWSLVYGQCESGEKLQDVMTKILRRMRSKVACRHSMDSPSCEGRTCVLSDPIIDSILSPDTFWRQTKEFIQKKADRVLPDGGIVQKAAAGSWELFETSAAHTKHVFDEVNKEIVAYTYRDAGLTDRSLETVRHLRIHTRPYRLEMWTAPADQRRAGDDQLRQINDILGPVLEQARLMETAPNFAADTMEFSRLHMEVSAFRREVTDALHALHVGAGTLKAM